MTTFTISDIRSERLSLPFYFLSDNHLSTRKGPKQSSRINDMLILLEEVLQRRGTLFILGDFFDFWFDKNAYVPPVLEPVIKALRDIVNAGIEIHYVGGNHDFWIEGYLTRELGIRFYPDALEFSWNGARIYCQHGDHAVYIGNQYPRIRNLLRHPLPIGMLKLLPITWTYKLGERVSHYNRDIPDDPNATDLLIEKMKKDLSGRLNNNVDLAISGHVHAPFMASADGKTQVILGDWIEHRSYGYMDDTGFRLIDMNKK